MNSLANDLSRLGKASKAYLGARHQLFIDGKFVDGSSSETIPVVDPTSGLEVGRIPAGQAKRVGVFPYLHTRALA